MNSRILAFVLAGGEGRRLHPLTLGTPKPAVELRRGLPIVDFVLSNLVNSGVPWIYLLMHYKPGPLLEHISRVWLPALARRGCTLRPLCPEGPEGAYRGTADAVYRHLDLVRQHDPYAVAVFAADHVYRMDLRPMALFHHRHAADITVAAVPVPLEEAERFGVIDADHDGRIGKFQEKPAQPASIAGDPARALASMGNYLFDPTALCELLEELAGHGGTDFGHDALPLAVQSGMRVFAYDFSHHHVPGLKPYEEANYWRDIGTPGALAEARHDLDGPTPRFDLRNPRWPLQPARSRIQRHLY